MQGLSLFNNTMNKANKIYIDKSHSFSYDKYSLSPKANDLNDKLRFIRFNNAPYIVVR